MSASVSSRGQRAALSALRRPIRMPGPAPFICANCQRAAATQPKAFIQTTASRPLSITTRQQEQTSRSEPTPSSQPARRENILPQTHYDFFPETFPSGPPPNSPFTPDLRQLRKEYLTLQSKTHPDLASADQKRHAEALSMRLNEAYKTLQEPLNRARYLLALQGIDMEDESAQLADNELLMEVMELREAVDEAESEEDLVGLREENDGRIGASVRILEERFARGDWEGAAEEAVRLRYWTNVEESIVGWEKGKGGGLLHH